MLLLILVAGSLVTAYSIWTGIFGFLRNYLRKPSANWRKVVRLAADTGAPIPKDIITPQVRRQLILEGEIPALYSNSNSQLPSSELHRQNRVIYGFFHPSAYAAGGGERILWAAIKETLQDKRAVAAVYVAKGPITFAKMLETAQQRFNIHFTPQEIDRCVAIYLTQGHLVEAKIYPAFTLVGQTIGTFVLTYEAVSNLVPDVWVDTVGLAFSYPLVHALLHIPIIAYIHYPWVQSDMLASIKWWSPKQFYWRTLLAAYKWALGYTTVAMANGTWTKNHLSNIKKATVVYPACSTQSFGEPTAERSPAIVYVAQFRPEKRHEMLVRAFSQMHDAGRKLLKGKHPHLILIGSVRNKQDQELVQDLNKYALELGLTEKDYTILINSPWENIRKILTTSLIGVNAMWNEHFGMGVVEVMAAGLIPVAHASAGPLYDIVKDEQGVPGFLFKSKQDPDYSPGYPNLRDALLKALELTPQEKRAYSVRAYNAAQRFSDAEFFKAWKQTTNIEQHIVKCEVWRIKHKIFD